MAQQIFLIRHGATDWSESGRHTGRTDIPLNARGRAAARRLRSRLRGLEFSRVFVSPRRRAGETCELAGLGARAKIEPSLAEWDYGAYEGLRSPEILADRPRWNIFRDGCPGGESPAQVRTRADRLIARLRLLPGNVVLFTHGHFGRAFAVRWLGLPLREAQHLLLGTASLSILGYEPKPAGPPVISLWNEPGPAASSRPRPRASPP